MKKIGISLLAGFLISLLSAQAITLTEARTHSYINEPLKIVAKIVGEGEIVPAKYTDYLRYGYEVIDYNLHYDFTTSSDGEKFLTISTDNPINDPAFILLLRGVDEEKKATLLEVPIILDIRRPVSAEKDEASPQADTSIAGDHQSKERDTATHDAKEAVVLKDLTLEHYTGEYETYGPIKSGENLWNIAKSYVGDNKDSIQAFSEIIKEANPQGFHRDTLLKDATLQIPTNFDLLKITSDVKEEEIESFELRKEEDAEEIIEKEKEVSSQEETVKEEIAKEEVLEEVLEETLEEKDTTIPDDQTVEEELTDSEEAIESEEPPIEAEEETLEVEVEEEKVEKAKTTTVIKTEERTLFKQYGPVKEGETLWSIASRYASQHKLSTNRLLEDIKKANPRAFPHGVLISGVVLQIPVGTILEEVAVEVPIEETALAEEAQEVDLDEALEEVLEDTLTEETVEEETGEEGISEEGIREDDALEEEHLDEEALKEATQDDTISEDEFFEEKISEEATTEETGGVEDALEDEILEDGAEADALDEALIDEILVGETLVDEGLLDESPVDEMLEDEILIDEIQVDEVQQEEKLEAESPKEEILDEEVLEEEILEEETLAGETLVGETSKDKEDEAKEAEIVDNLEELSQAREDSKANSKEDIALPVVKTVPPASPPKRSLLDQAMDYSQEILGGLGALLLLALLLLLRKRGKKPKDPKETPPFPPIDSTLPHDDEAVEEALDKDSDRDFKDEEKIDDQEKDKEEATDKTEDKARDDDREEVREDEVAEKDLEEVETTLDDRLREEELAKEATTIESLVDEPKEVSLDEGLEEEMVVDEKLSLPEATPLTEELSEVSLGDDFGDNLDDDLREDERLIPSLDGLSVESDRRVSDSLDFELTSELPKVHEPEELFTDKLMADLPSSQVESQSESLSEGLDFTLTDSHDDAALSLDDQPSPTQDEPMVSQAEPSGLEFELPVMEEDTPVIEEEGRIEDSEISPTSVEEVISDLTPPLDTPEASLSLEDLPEATPEIIPVEDDAPALTPSSLEEGLQVKLDLAKAYIDLNFDANLAVPLLEEIIAEGNPKFTEQAEALLAQVVEQNRS